MRIGKITLDGYFNYGNILQSYALEKVLCRYSDKVDSLWYSPDNFIATTWKWGWKEQIKSIINWHQYRNRLNNNFFGYEMVRQARIRQFCQKYIHIRKVVNNLSYISNEYDFFVTGSDQVWNPDFSSTECYEGFLRFAPAEKRIAYAASFGISKLPIDFEKKAKKYLAEMSSISVREQAGAHIVQSLIGREVPILLDPTLLLSTSEWEKIERCPVWFNPKDCEKYVFIYFLGEKKTFLKSIVEKSNLKVINLLDMKNFDHYITSPEEFIFLIHHAALICTDSFHGTVFSILFQRPFIVCNRFEKGLKNMSSRIQSLLDTFHLQDRYYSKTNTKCLENSLQMIYPDLNNIFFKERKRSHEYLESALHTNKMLEWM